MVEPIGWASMRGSLHYKSVFPTVPDVGMQATLHKNLSKRLQPRDIIAVNQHNIDMARRILHRQRVALRLYSGSRLNLKGSTAHETSARLHRPLRQFTCPEGFNGEGSETYSNMRSEGSTLLTEASLYGPPPVSRDGHLPALKQGKMMSPIPGSSRSPDHLAYDPEKAPDSRGYLVKLKRPIVYQKKYTEAEVQNIVNRLADFDPLTHPAESKGQVREQPAIVTQVPRQSMTQIRKCTAAEVQQIVERLYAFDNSRYPAESKSRPVIHSGRPRQIQTAPSGEMKRPTVPSSAPAASSRLPSLAVDTNSEHASELNAPIMEQPDETDEDPFPIKDTNESESKDNKDELIKSPSVL